MVIKEAYHYMNVLDCWFEQCRTLLCDSTVTKQEIKLHRRKEANAEAEDLVEKSDLFLDGQVTAEDIVDFALSVLKEKEIIGGKIAAAKEAAGFRVDLEVSLNKKYRDMLASLHSIACQKTTSSISQGRGYAFNVNKEQVAYVYNIETKRENRVNTKVVRGIESRLKKECNERSLKIERFESLTEIDYAEKWDESIPLEDLLQEFANKAK